MHRPQRRDVVLVSSGLDLDGGGRALVGRLLARAASRYAAARRIGFEILDLGNFDPLLQAVPYRAFKGNQGGLSRAIWRRQLRRRQPAFLYDVLGPARAHGIVPRYLAAPYLLMLLGIEVWRPLSWTHARAVAGATIRLAISDYTRERARPFLPGGIGETGVLALALEQRPPMGDIDIELGRQAATGFALVVGRMSASEGYKGHDQILDAWPALLARHPDARLVVTGEGDDRPRLEAKAHALGLGRSVLFTGFVSEATLRDLYRRSAAFVMTSRGEGFGLVYLEAMRAAKPCLAARGSAAGEIIEEGVTGHLVDPDEPTELLAALERLLTNPEHAHRLGRAGLARWRERFSTGHFEAGLTPHLDRLTRLD